MMYDFLSYCTNPYNNNEMSGDLLFALPYDATTLLNNAHSAQTRTPILLFALARVCENGLSDPAKRDSTRPDGVNARDNVREIGRKLVFRDCSRS